MRIWLCALLMSLATPALALEPAELGRTLAGSPYVEARFSQEKIMAGLSRPLKTWGSMALARDAGVLWQVEKPYTFGYFLSAGRVIEFVDGRRQEQDTSKLPWLTQVAAIMNALLAGDIPALSALFELELKGTAAAWQMRLRPKQAQLAAVIQRIELSGGRQIESLSLFEANGDRTAIRFEAMSTPSRLPKALIGLVPAG